MARLTFLRDMKHIDTSMLEKIQSYLFGDKNINNYEENKVYNKGDLILITNNVTGKTEVYEAKEDGVTGEFDPSKWGNTSITETVNGGKLDNMIVIDSDTPTTPDTKLWLQIQGVTEFHPGYDLIDADYYSMRSHNGTVPVEPMGDVPTDSDVKMFFTKINEYSDEYKAPGQKPEKVELKKQQDLHTTQDNPTEDSKLWINRKE